MCFEKILKVINTVMPLITVVVSCCFVPVLLDWWKSRKLRSCYNSLISCFDKFCYRLGGTCPYIVRETTFDNDSAINTLIDMDKNKPVPAEEQNWADSQICPVLTNLNDARTKLGLGSGKFYLSRYFCINGCELLVVLTVNGNTANMQAFNRGKWAFPKREKKSKLHKVRVKLFGAHRYEYSNMLV